MTLDEPAQNIPPPAPHPWLTALRRHWPLLLLAAFAWVQRDGIFKAHPVPKYWPDTPTYYPNALYFLGTSPQGKELSGHNRNMMIMRVPVYSAMMALTSGNGLGLKRMNSFDWIDLYRLQLRLGILTTLVFYGIGFVYSNSRAIAFACGLAYTAAWQNINYETILLTESPSFFFSGLAVLCYALACKRGERVWWLSAGATAALAYMTRPSLIVMMPLFLAGPFLRGGAEAWRGRLKQLATLAAGFLLVTQPWALRNYTLGSYWGVSNAGPCNMSGLLAPHFKFNINPTQDEWMLIRFFEAANKQYNGYYGRAWAPGPGVLLSRGWTVGRYTRTLRSLCIKTLMQPDVLNDFIAQSPLRYNDAWRGQGTEGLIEAANVHNLPFAPLYAVSDAIFMREGRRGGQLMPWLLLAGLLAAVLAGGDRWRHPLILALVLFPFLTAAALLIDPVEIDRHFMTCQPLLLLALVLLTGDSFLRAYRNRRAGRGIVGLTQPPETETEPPPEAA